VTRIVSFLALAMAIALPASAQVAVRAETLHTMAGPAVKDGVVVIGRDGTIERIGPAASTPIPKDYRVLRARVATPGLIDAHTVVGLAGALNQPHDQMQLERSAPLLPELRALDAYNPREVLVEWVRNHGTTTLHTGHAPGALLSGQTMIVKTRPGAVEDVVIEPAAMLAVTLGPQGLAESGKAPGTRAKSVAMLRSELVKTREHVARAGAAEDTRPARDLRQEALARVVRKEQPLLVTADRLVDLHAALRLAREFDIRLVLDGAAEAYLLLDAIKAAGVPVFLHPMMRRGVGESENMSTSTAAALRDAGIPFALQSGYESYVPKTRVVLFEAAIAAARGLTFEQALASITIDAARILGIDRRVGSLEPGKDGDVALYDGDPFEYTTRVTGVVIDGQVVSEDAH
jgi:imidazolonepropionase-like amidohydrolase